MSTTTILEKKSGSGQVRSKIQHIIYGVPSEGTYGNYWLMKDELRKQDEDWIIENSSRWDQLAFNTKFLQDTFAKHGELHCEYCGKPNLVIYAWNHLGPKSNMATADHFIPKSLDKAKLMYDLSNMRVACYKCNTKKSNFIWDESTLRFKY